MNNLYPELVSWDIKKETRHWGGERQAFFGGTSHHSTSHSHPTTVVFVLQVTFRCRKRVLLGECESHQHKSTMPYIGISVSYNNLRQFVESLQGKCPVSNVTIPMEDQSLAFHYGFICNPFYSIHKLLFRDHFYHKKCYLLTSWPFSLSHFQGNWAGKLTQVQIFP